MGSFMFALAGTLMFTSLGSFFNRISDPEMGGAYLTLLNTIANMGRTPGFLCHHLDLLGAVQGRIILQLLQESRCPSLACSG